MHICRNFKYIVFYTFWGTFLNPQFLPGEHNSTCFNSELPFRWGGALWSQGASPLLLLTYLLLFPSFSPLLFSSSPTSPTGIPWGRARSVGLGRKCEERQISKRPSRVLLWHLQRLDASGPSSWCEGKDQRLEKKKVTTQKEKSSKEEKHNQNVLFKKINYKEKITNEENQKRKQKRW